MRIRDIMSKAEVVLLPDVSLLEAASMLYKAGLDGAAVVDEDRRIIGIVTKANFLKAMAEQRLLESPVGSIMKTGVHTLQAMLPIITLRCDPDIFSYGFYPVLDDKRQLCGYITRPILMQYLSDSMFQLVEELKAVLDSTYNGVIAINAAGKVIWYNAAAERLMQLPAAKVVGQLVDEVVPNTALLRVIQTGEAEVNQQQRIYDKVIITNRTPIIKDGKCIGAVGVFQDITELQSVADELEHIKNLKSTLESVLESEFSRIVVVDRSGRISRMNQAYLEFLGYESPSQVIGKHVTEIIENTRMHIVAQTGKAEIMDVQKIGNRNCVVTRTPIMKDGEIVGAVGTVDFKDVKELKSLARKVSKLQSELEYYKEELIKAHGGKYTFDSIIGDSEKMKWLKTTAMRAAKGNSTVLILGESGTGKELFAHALHNASSRRNGPFIKVNCAAIPENLLESELFGYDEGAFTGAKRGGKPGKFELANGGTIFLDEIGDMAFPMQAKLLRVLQEKEIERVGGTKTIKIDVRVIAATNRDIEAMIEQNNFRQDLYYRLNIISLQIPALREHKEDIPLLSMMLLRKIALHTPHDVEGVAKEAEEYLVNYAWPGNVRELENVLERAINLMDDERYILPEHLPPVIKRSYQNPAVDSGAPPIPAARSSGRSELGSIKKDAEREALWRALIRSGGNKTRAAKLLGIQRSAFYEKLKQHGITGKEPELYQ